MVNHAHNGNLILENATNALELGLARFSTRAGEVSSEVSVEVVIPDLGEAEPVRVPIRRCVGQAEGSVFRMKDDIKPFISRQAARQSDNPLLAIYKPVREASSA